MPRYLIVAGIDFGTSFTKVVLRDNNTPGSNALVVSFPQHPDGLLPSLVGIDNDALIPPASSGRSAKIPYLKMLAAHVAGGEKLEQSSIRTPAGLESFRSSRSDLEIVRELLAFFFAHVMAVIEDFIRHRSPWRDFDFRPGNDADFLVFQLAVPTGLMGDKGATERLFREAMIAGYELRGDVDALMKQAVRYDLWSGKVAQVFEGDRSNLESRFRWQCLLYPEVAAAVQTVFRSPSASDGLHITMDVGAGTVDLNAFLRFTGNRGARQAGTAAIRNLDYYSAMVCPLGVQNLSDPHHAVRQRSEEELMEELRQDLQNLFLRAKQHQPNHGHTPGKRTWDTASLFIFGGGSHHKGYRRNFASGLNHAGIYHPQIHNLPAARDLTRQPGVEFGRFAVAYGLSFFRPSLDHVRLPHELTPFRVLYPQVNAKPPKRYGFSWDD